MPARARSDTDFYGRLSDVFPDGRAIQLQSGMVRARYRDAEGEPELLEPGKIYRFDIDMWATANRFAAGHCLRLDISSADFPKFERNNNRGGEQGPSVLALQIIYHDSVHPSHLLSVGLDIRRPVAQLVHEHTGVLAVVDRRRLRDERQPRRSVASRVGTSAAALAIR